MDKMHHANIIITSQNPIDKVEEILLSEISFKIKGNPDFFLIEEDSFGVENAKVLERWSIGKPLGESKVCLVVSRTINFEAQNALLKMLEEPKEKTYFFITVESQGLLIPTLLSRVRIMDFVENKESNKKAEQFVKSSISERLSLVRSLQKNADKNKIKDFIRDLENISSLESLSFSQKDNILKAKIYSMQRGASGKMLLEWLSCVL